MTGLEITHGQRAGWQRRAAAELAAILDAHRDLPIIGWSLAAAGSSLVGHISGTTQARATFDAWRAALMLNAHNQVICGDGTALLSAAAERNRVRVRLSATVIGDQPGQVSP